MFENKLPFFVKKTLESLNPKQMQSLEKALTEGDVSSFDKAYECVIRFWKLDLADYNISPDSVIATMADMKPIVALYATYYALDYIYKQKMPEGQKFNFKFIQDFYQCDKNAARDIYNGLRRQVKEIKDIIEYPDPLLVNPYAVAKYESQKITESKLKFVNVYLGSLLEYLSESIVHQEKRLYIHDLVPSVSMIALRAAGSLPNGGTANKSNKISSNIIDRIDREIKGGIIYEDIEGILTVQGKISISGYESIEELITWCVIEDIYRVERLHYALARFDEVIGKTKKLTKKQEERIALICSLYQQIPLFLCSFIEEEIDICIEAVTDKRKKPLQEAALFDIFFFTAVLFPVSIGLTVSLMFGKIDIASTNDSYSASIKDTADIEKGVRKILPILEENYEDLLQSFVPNGKRIWNEDEATDTSFNVEIKNKNKGNGRTNGFVEWKKPPHKLTLSNTIWAMINQKKCVARTRNLIDENSIKVRDKKFALMLQENNNIPVETTLKILRTSEKHSEMKYVYNLVHSFLYDMWDE